MKRKLALILPWLLPLWASAAVTIESILSKTEELLYQVIGILVIIATLVFMWGIIRYVSAGGDEDKIKEGRNFMIFGIIGLAVMISVWGLVFLLTNTFGFEVKPIPRIEEP
jgi:O-antigen/teichoic acid export membrane protein